MARPLRLAFKDGLYHVTARGNGRQLIFEDDIDRESFMVEVKDGKQVVKEVLPALGKK